MPHEHNREDYTSDDVADDHLDKSDVPAVSHRWHADDCQGAGFRRDDGKPDAPPGNGFASEKIIARVMLVSAEPNAEADNPEQIKKDDSPISRAKVTAHRGKKTGLTTDEHR